MATNGTIDERYLIWLHRQLEPDTQRNPVRSHWLLCSQLYQTEFVWFIPNDDNRLLDGLDIRTEFVDEEEGGDVPGWWYGEPCSYLEMFIALSRRMAFESGLEPDYWFWTLMGNLKLRDLVDEIYNEDATILVDETLQRLSDRTYHADGSGGIFPLYHPGTDQRKVEIWYQMSHYLNENINV